MSKDATCNTTLNPLLMGYNSFVSGDTFQMIIDVRTLMTALAVLRSVNGPLTLGSFTVIKVLAQGTFKGVPYQALQMFDPQYPGMQAMACIGPTSSFSSASNFSNWNCLLPFGDSYGLPFFLSHGANETAPVACNCSTSTGKASNCDNFDFLTGALVYNWNTNTTFSHLYSPSFLPFLPFLELTTSGVSFTDANDMVFEAAFAALHSQFPGSEALFRDHTWRKAQYQFSYTPTFGYASLVVFRTYTTNGKYISPTFFQLQNGGCSDSFYSPNFSNFYTNSWGDLDETYYRCTMNSTDAIFNSIGISFGTATSIAPIAMMIIMYCCLAFGAVFFGEASQNRDDRDAEVSDAEGSSLEILGEGADAADDTYSATNSHSSADDAIDFRDQVGDNNGEGMTGWSKRRKKKGAEDDVEFVGKRSSKSKKNKDRKSKNNNLEVEKKEDEFNPNPLAWIGLW